ncbi:MAG TPA: group II truncated hemoglobin [Longimicrobiales bacterium]|nr:group II truncated hemoglobin [Longimicrobiales bacterium]
MKTDKITHFEQIGGASGVRRLVDRFYDLMDTVPEAATIRAMHPPTLDSSREKLHLFLVGWLGGPQLYVERFGPPMLRARHLPFSIGDEEADAWIGCMSQALDEQDMPEELREFLRERFRAMADHMRNRFPGAEERGR